MAPKMSPSGAKNERQKRIPSVSASPILAREERGGGPIETVSGHRARRMGADVSNLRVPTSLTDGAGQ